MQVNRRRAAMVPPAPLVTPIAADPKFTEQFVLARHLVRHADSELLTSLSHVFGGTLRGKTLIEAAGNSGTKLIKLLLDEATKATGRDRSVVSAKHQLIISQGVKGEVNSLSLDKFLKEYKLAKQNMPPALRQPDEAELEMINTVAHADPGIRDIYTLKTTVAPPSTFDEAINTVKQILDDSEKADEIDALRAGTALSVQPAALANAAAFFYMRAVVMNEKRARDATP